jgi:dolichol kinase
MAQIGLARLDISTNQVKFLTRFINELARAHEPRQKHGTIIYFGIILILKDMLSKS